MPSVRERERRGEEKGEEREGEEREEEKEKFNQYCFMICINPKLINY